MKKGFTLIELLAVIVILAIIALIATPIVLSIINDSKESSQLRSAEMYLKGLETSIATATLESKVVKTGSYSIMNSGNICLEYKDNECTNELKVEMNGEKPESGKVTVSNGQVIDLILNYKNKTIVRNNDELTYSYKESSNIEVPDLYNGTLTPVIYDGYNWIIADVSKKWYDYSKQEWANAVILNKDSTKKVGDKLVVDGTNPDILAMLVWIPRYEYKIDGEFGVHTNGTVGTKELPGEIKVNFININKKEASDTYIIHPAFNFGGTDISGIWVAKFELSHATKKTSRIDCADENCAEGNSLRILPNVSSFRCNENANFFYAIRSMSQKDNTFGIDNNITDTHMIKNSEWGAVAYLTQSKYGKYGNSDYEGREKEVYINNSGNYYTGRSGGSYGGNTAVNTVYIDQTDVTTQYVGTGYYTYDGYLLQYNSNTKTEPETRNMKKIASTTGNIYGIYDMSGGAWDGVMSVTIDVDGNIYTNANNFSGIVFNSGYKEGITLPEEKYYDVYLEKDITKACNGGICYGHALSETELWYGNSKGFVWTQFPYLLRGGSFVETTSGIFSSRQGTTSNGDRSTRTVFTPTT